MIILGIETSCDETALSILECSGDLAAPEFKVIDSIINSQAKLHAEYGGVFPTLAKREHQKNLPILLEELMNRNGERKIGAIAVTQGPGLEPALWTGIVFAKELGEKWNVPVIPTNHMEGHVVSVLLENKQIITFPALALLISGGHTQLVKVNSWGSYEAIGDTCDDAVGEAFDKVARILGLAYPGGPEISKLADQAREEVKNAKNSEASEITLPRPMLHSKDFNFSFSGLKTAVLYLVQKLEKGSKMNDEVKKQIAREFEDSVTEVLVKKTIKAIEEIGASTLILGGGVTANRHIRKTFEKVCKKTQVELLLPTHEASTDNALMIAAASYISYLQNRPINKAFSANGNLMLDK